MSTTRLLTPGSHLLSKAISRLEQSGPTSQAINIVNHAQIAGYKKKQSNKLVFKPKFAEYDKMTGDEYQTVYKGFYDDKRHNDPRAFTRFYRLNWGGWIRARGGRGSRTWQRDGPSLWWAKQHVLCSQKQVEQLEQMFEQKYRKKTFFVDDPYEIYEERNDIEFLPYGHRPYSYSYMRSKDFGS